MSSLALHLAPNAPAWLLLAGSLALLALAIWAYRFAFPPLSLGTRRLLTALRVVALLVLLWLFAQPVLERALPASGRRVTILVDRSASMRLPASLGGPTRAAEADRLARAIAGAWRGRASVNTRGFAAALFGDSARAADDVQSTALGEALAQLGDLPLEQRPDGIVVVSDGVVNAGRDPVAAASALGIPVHTVLVGAPLGADRAIAEVEAASSARVGEATPVRVRVRSSEPRGTPLTVHVREDGRELAKVTVPAPGPGLESVAEARVTPTRAGLALWSAALDPLRGDAAPQNDRRGVAVPVAPGKLGATIVTAGLNWDLAFVRRSLAADSSLSLHTIVRERDGWRELESGRAVTPGAEALHGQSVVILDALAPLEVSAAFDGALGAFAREGGGLLLLSGAAPGLARYARGALAGDLRVEPLAAPERTAAPQASAAAAEILAWDDDAARGEQAWRSAAPLASVQALRAGGGDRVLLSAQEGGTPLVFTRRIGRGPALLVNGTGFWRWGLSGTDELSAERGKRLWRHVVRWLSEPVQGEPLRVQPERWLSAGGENVRLVATLQNDAFAPVSGARVEGRAEDGAGHSLPLVFTPRGAGGYEATLPAPAAGRWRLEASASKDGRALGRARSEFAVDTWSLEALESAPDSASLALLARASGGRSVHGADAADWARALETRALTRPRTSTVRLWESPWVFALVVLLLASEWILRRRRGLP